MKWTTKYESIFLNKRGLPSVFILKLSKTLEFKNRTQEYELFLTSGR